MYRIPLLLFYVIVLNRYPEKDEDYYNTSLVHRLD